MGISSHLQSWQKKLEKFEDLPARAVYVRVAILAALVRVAYFATSHGGTWDEPVLDADTNLAVARAFIHGSPSEPFWQPPGFSWILSLILRISDSLLFARAVFAALSCVTVVMVTSALIALKKSNSVAAIAGTLVALNAALLYYDGDFLPPSLATFCLSAAVWSTVVLKDGWRRSLLVGACVGFATLTVGTLIFALAPLTLHKSAHRGFGPYGTKHILSCLFAFGLIVSPAVVHNYTHNGGASVALSGGINLWIGNNPDMNETIALRPGAGWEALANEPERTLHRRTTAREYDQYFVQKTKTFCVQQPGPCALNVLQRVRQLANSKEIARNESLMVARRQSPVLEILYNGVGTFFWPWGVLMVLGAVGVFSSMQKRMAIDSQNAMSLFRWLLLALAMGPLVFFVTGRYRVPMIPLMAVFAALGAEHLWTHRRSMSGWLIALAALVLTAWPMHLPVDRVRFDSELHYLIAGAQLRRNDTSGAERSLKQALRANPRYLEAGMNLGLLYIRQRRLADAFGVYDAIVRFHPESTRARLAFAAVSMDTESFADALAQYQAVLLVEPQNKSAISGLCVLAVQQNRRAEAQALYARIQASGGVDETDPPPGWRICEQAIRAMSP